MQTNHEREREKCPITRERKLRSTKEGGRRTDRPRPAVTNVQAGTTGADVTADGPQQTRRSSSLVFFCLPCTRHVRHFCGSHSRDASRRWTRCGLLNDPIDSIKLVNWSFSTANGLDCAVCLPTDEEAAIGREIRRLFPDDPSLIPCNRIGANETFVRTCPPHASASCHTQKTSKKKSSTLKSSTLNSINGKTLCYFTPLLHR